MLNGNFSERGLALVSQLHFVLDFLRKMFLLIDQIFKKNVSTNRANFNV